MKEKMNSMERTLCALNHKEPDRIPLFLLFSHYGARYLDKPIREYFQSSESVVKAQIELRKIYNTDCYYTFSYASVEVEAMGGEVLFADNAPPNAGTPIIKEDRDILKLQVPEINDTQSLLRVLETTASLHQFSCGTVPVIGVVMSPFSLPVMQMGFDKYIELLYYKPDLFKHLMDINQEFCAQWANAQLSAGATAICYFNPLWSREMIETGLYQRTGYKVDMETIKKIKGPVASHLASARTLPSLDEVISSGSAVVGVSSNDDLMELKKRCSRKITILGNLNGIEMAEDKEETIHQKIKTLAQTAGTGGGFIISDNHGEIPWQVPDKNLRTISQAVREWGTYPLARES